MRWIKSKSNKYKLPPTAIASTRDRLVYDVGSGLIMKVARTKQGKKDNNYEVKLYKKVPSSLKKYLAKVLDHGPGWLVMEKVMTPLPKYGKYNKKVREIANEFKKHGIKARDILTRKHKEPKRHNLGLNREGKIVVIDYEKFIIE